jgi:hypothetical protein
MVNKMSNRPGAPVVGIIWWWELLGYRFDPADDLHDLAGDL